MLEQVPNTALLSSGLMVVDAAASLPVSLRMPHCSLARTMAPPLVLLRILVEELARYSASCHCSRRFPSTDTVPSFQCTSFLLLYHTTICSVSCTTGGGGGGGGGGGNAFCTATTSFSAFLHGGGPCGSGGWLDFGGRCGSAGRVGIFFTSGFLFTFTCTFFTDAFGFRCAFGFPTKGCVGSGYQSSPLLTSALSAGVWSSGAAQTPASLSLWSTGAFRLAVALEVLAFEFLSPCAGDFGFHFPHDSSSCCCCASRDGTGRTLQVGQWRMPFVLGRCFCRTTQYSIHLKSSLSCLENLQSL